VLDLKEQLQEDLMAVLDGLPSEVITAACQIVVDRFNEQSGKELAQAKEDPQLQIVHNSYQVECSNIGVVHNGHDLTEAEAVWAAYRDLSKTNEGRVGGEDVSLWRTAHYKDGSQWCGIIQEYTGALTIKKYMEENN